MQKRVKVMILGVVTALVLVLPLAAQSVSQSMGSLSSDTNTATATLFKSDADNFITVDRWSRVKFDKAFVFVSGDASGPLGGKVSLGYATTLGDLYLGAWYQGGVVQVTKPETGDTEKTTVESSYDNERRELVSTEKTTEYNESWINSANQIEILLGVANQGIKVGFYESVGKNRHPGSSARDTVEIDYKDGRIDYQNAVDEYARTKGYLKPYLGWGTDLEVSEKLKLRPYVNFGVEVFNDNLIDKYSDYTTIKGKKQDVSTSFGAGYSNGYVAPQATIGAKFDSPTKSGAAGTFIIDYALDLRLYNNSAEATGFSGDAVKGTVAWAPAKVKQVTNYFDHTQTSTSIDLSIEEKKWAKHTITPQWMVTGSPASGFSLGFKTTAPISITADSGEKYQENHALTDTKFASEPYKNTSSNIVTRTNDGLTQNTVTTAQLNLMVGAQYKLVPDRFTINGGITAAPVSLTHTVARTAENSQSTVKTTTVKDGDGNVDTHKVEVTKDATATDTVSVIDTWNAFTGSVRGGFTFNFTPKAALDMSIVAPVTPASFSVDITNVHVLLSLKF